MLSLTSGTVAKCAMWDDSDTSQSVQERQVPFSAASSHGAGVFQNVVTVQQGPGHMKPSLHWMKWTKDKPRIVCLIEVK